MSCHFLADKSADKSIKQFCIYVIKICSPPETFSANDGLHTLAAVKAFYSWVPSLAAFIDFHN